MFSLVYDFWWQWRGGRRDLKGQREVKPTLVNEEKPLELLDKTFEGLYIG